MDRKKPRLTSPWKVGFLVALLLVVTALGVTYYITGTFGITWHWIQVGGLSPMTWKFHVGAFLEEMVPLLILTSLLAFGAYVLVAGAVRRYKAYVDSGVEYKQLLKSIKSVDDLEDSDVTSRLKEHPELREFLMSVKHRVAALERPQAERAVKHAPSAPPANSVSRDTVASECATLASAIDGGRDAFPSDITLTIPELKQIERAVRRFIASMPVVPVTDASAAELEEMRHSVRSTLDALRRDMAACGSGAREVEEAVVALKNQLEAGTARPVANAAALQKRIDAVAEALTVLGEETRRIAIASALQASGGPDADSIKIADELKALATKFNVVARHWGETSPALKQILAGDSKTAGSDAAAAVAGIAARARLWGERAVVINEHVRALERAAGITPSSRPTPAGDAASAYEAPAAPAASSSRDAHDSEDDFITRRNAEPIVSDTSDDISFADIPGFEKERRFFGDAPAEGEEKDDRFVVDSQQDRRWDLSEEHVAEEPVAKAAPKPDPRPDPKQDPKPDPDGFLTGPRPTVKKGPRVATPQPAPVEAAPQTPAVVDTGATATATLDPDADAIDLYALGAIDCVSAM